MDEDGIVILVLDTPISEATVTIVTYGRGSPKMYAECLVRYKVD